MGHELLRKSAQNVLKEQAKYNTFQSDCLNPLFLYMSYISFAGNLEGMHLPSKRKGIMNKKPRLGKKQDIFFIRGQKADFQAL